MSGTLQGIGLFPSKKRRSGEVADGLKRYEGKRPNTAGKLNNAGSSSSSVSRVVAGAVAPVQPNKHVQEAIHEEVHYSREGQEGVPQNTLKVFRFVKEAFVIPDDFDKNHRYGPLSGVSHELRVVSAYMAGQLKSHSKSFAGIKMCLECGNKGHFPRNCPYLLIQ